MSLKLALLLSPFLIQAGLMFFDEFYFHHKRGLPLWERIGHPLDTLTVIACFGFLLANTYTSSNLTIYIGLVIFSSIFITKDEFIHHENSVAKEQWLHSVLFVVHPIIFTISILYWFDPSIPGGPLTESILNINEFAIFKKFIQGQIVLTIIFLSYQILYWSIPWKKLVVLINLKKESPSTMTTTTTSEKIG